MRSSLDSLLATLLLNVPVRLELHRLVKSTVLIFGLIISIQARIPMPFGALGLLICDLVLPTVLAGLATGCGGNGSSATLRMFVLRVAALELAFAADAPASIREIRLSDNTRGGGGGVGVKLVSDLAPIRETLSLGVMEGRNGNISFGDMLLVRGHGLLGSTSESWLWFGYMLDV